MTASSAIIYHFNLTIHSNQWICVQGPHLRLITRCEEKKPLVSTRDWSITSAAAQMKNLLFGEGPDLKPQQTAPFSSSTLLNHYSELP